jgi:hypothetical protein
MRVVPLAALVIGTLAIAACHKGRSPTWTLYRSEAVGDTARIHVATFDAVEDEEAYNRDGCERTRELYQVQPSNRARFWCEAGSFHEKR